MRHAKVLSDHKPTKRTKTDAISKGKLTVRWWRWWFEEMEEKKWWKYEDDDDTRITTCAFHFSSATKASNLVGTGTKSRLDWWWDSLPNKSSDPSSKERTAPSDACVCMLPLKGNQCPSLRALSALFKVRREREEWQRFTWIQNEVVNIVSEVRVFDYQFLKNEDVSCIKSIDSSFAQPCIDYLNSKVSWMNS